MKLECVGKFIEVVERDTLFSVKSYEPLSYQQNRHTNQIFKLELLNDEQETSAYLKIYPSSKLVNREIWCYGYLTGYGLKTPSILTHGSNPSPYIVTMDFGRNGVTEGSLHERVRDIANIHVNSMLFDQEILSDIASSRVVDRRTASVRIKEIDRQRLTLQDKGLLSEVEVNAVGGLTDLVLEQEGTLWESSFCFLDFFMHNQKKTSNGLYYFDFERFCISVPFYDPACLIIDRPEEEGWIKKRYFDELSAEFNRYEENNPATSEEVAVSLDLAVCEKTLIVIEFMLDETTKKPWSRRYCDSVITNYKQVLVDHLNSLEQSNH